MPEAVSTLAPVDTVTTPAGQNAVVTNSDAVADANVAETTGPGNATLDATGVDGSGLDVTTGIDASAIGSGAPDGLAHSAADLAASTGQVDTVTGMFDSAREFLNVGGPVVMILAVLSLVGMTIILAKLMQYSANRVGRHGKAEKALLLWLGGNRAEAYSLIRDHRSPASQVLAHAMRGIQHASATEAQVREDIERICLEILDGLKSWLRALDAIAQVSPLLGLFGTVIGMIEAFQSLQSAGASVDPSALAGGIWVALMTTAVGLAVAIPASLVSTWLEGRIDGERVAMERFLTGFFTGRVTEFEPVAAVADIRERLVHAG